MNFSHVTKNRHLKIDSKYKSVGSSYNDHHNQKKVPKISGPPSPSKVLHLSPTVSLKQTHLNFTETIPRSFRSSLQSLPFYSVLFSTSSKSAHYQTFSDPQKPKPKPNAKTTTMLLLIPTFFFTLTIFLTSFFFLILLLNHYRHIYILLSKSFLTFQWLHLPHWFEPPPQRTSRPKNQANMTLKGATSQACAACKYQRRKCTPECPLAPFFPPDQPKMFQNAHKLFGVCNILKILKSVDPCLKFETMKSIIYQANIRDKFPVYGCWEVIWQLQYQIMVAEQELQNVHKQLAMYRQHHYQQQISAMPDYVTSQLELGMAPPNNNSTISLLNHSSPQGYDNNNNAIPHALPVTQQQQQPYSNESDDAYTSAYDIDSKQNYTEENVLWAQNPFNINENNDNAETVQSQFGVSQTVAIESEDVQDYDDLNPFFDTIDDRQSYIDSKEAYESSSSEESFKDTKHISMNHAEDNTLKSAAACFSLTSVKLSVS